MTFRIIFLTILFTASCASLSDGAQDGNRKTAFAVLTEEPEIRFVDDENSSEFFVFTAESLMGVDDYYFEYDFCDDADGLICVNSDMLPIFVPRNSNTVYSRANFEYYVASEGVSSAELCDLENFSVVVIDELKHRYYEYRFSQKKGLIRWSLYKPDLFGKYRVTNNFVLRKGNFLTFEDKC